MEVDNHWNRNHLESRMDKREENPSGTLENSMLRCFAEQVVFRAVRLKGDLSAYRPDRAITARH